MSLNCRWLRADEDAREDWIVVPVKAPRIEWYDFIRKIAKTDDLPVLANYIKRSERDFCVSRISEPDDVVIHDASGDSDFQVIFSNIVYLSKPDTLEKTLYNIVRNSPTTLLFMYLVKRFHFHCSCEILLEISEIVFERSMNAYKGSFDFTSEEVKGQQIFESVKKANRDRQEMFKYMDWILSQPEYSISYISQGDIQDEPPNVDVAPHDILFTFIHGLPSPYFKYLFEQFPDYFRLLWPLDQDCKEFVFSTVKGPFSRDYWAFGYEMIVLCDQSLAESPTERLLEYQIINLESRNAHGHHVIFNTLECLVNTRISAFGQCKFTCIDFDYPLDRKDILIRNFTFFHLIDMYIFMKKVLAFIKHIPKSFLVEGVLPLDPNSRYIDVIYSYVPTADEHCHQKRRQEHEKCFLSFLHEWMEKIYSFRENSRFHMRNFACLARIIVAFKTELFLRAQMHLLNDYTPLNLTYGSYLYSKPLSRQLIKSRSAIFRDGGCHHKKTRSSEKTIEFQNQREAGRYLSAVLKRFMFSMD